MLNRKIALAVATLAAIGLVAWVATRDAGTPAAPVVAPSVAPAKGDAQRDERLESADAKRSAVQPATVPPAAESSVPVSDAPHPTAIVRAHCIDEQRKPIAGVKLITPGNKPIATSDADGRIDARLPLWRNAEKSSIWFTLAGAFHLKHLVSRVLAPDEVCDLGDVVMTLGGRILGRVVDENGKPCAGASVATTRVAFVDWKTTDEKDSSASQCRPDGAFELDGVPAGSMRAAARTRGYVPGEVSPLEIVPGQEVRDVEIKLTEHAPERGFDFIVRVLDPSGKPVPNAPVRFDIRYAEGESAGSTTADEHGVRKLHGELDCHLDVRAADPESRYSAAYAFDVPGDRRSLDLRLDVATPRTLLVLDEHEKPIERFAWRMLDEMQFREHGSGLIARDPRGNLLDTLRDFSASGAFPSEHFERKAHPAGRVDLFTPQIAFALQIDAEGYAIAEVGPLDPSSAPSEIRVAMQPLPGVRGRVVAAGAGVPNAWVKLFPARGDDRTITVHGFPSRVETTATAETRTGDDGSFNLSLRDAGSFVVQAGDGSGRESEAAPIASDPRVGATVIDLELLPLGAIEGRVLVAANEIARDIVVGASRGEGRPRSVRTDADGRFRFEKLTPGRWLLRAVEEDIAPDDRSSAIDFGTPSDPEMPFTCEVRPGETARVDIDLRTKAELAFDIDLPGWSGGKWSAWIRPRGASFGLPKQSRSVDLAELHVASDQPGDYQLFVSVGTSSPFRGIQFAENVHLDAGKNTWKFAGPCGELTLVNKKNEPIYGYLQCDLSAARRASVTVHLDARATTKMSGIPLGRWTRVHWDGGKSVEDDHVDVTSDGGARVEWN
jgi:uncharacterized GH25 family protein